MRVHRSPLEVAEWIVRCTNPGMAFVCRECPWHNTGSEHYDCSMVLAMDASELIRDALAKKNPPPAVRTLKAERNKISTPLL